MKKDIMRALICGHTGATGKVVLDELVNATWIESIVTIGRREYPQYLNHPKVKQIIVTDMTDLSSVNLEEIGKVDLAFDFVATTLKDAFKGEEVYRKADVVMASEFARVAKEAGASYLSAISIKGVEKGEFKKKDYSKKAKYDFEKYVRTLGFERLALMYPDWVNRENRWYEYIYTLGGLRGIYALDIAKCIVWSAKNQKESERGYSVKEMKNISKTKI